jgi:hypothetical protein
MPGASGSGCCQPVGQADFIFGEQDVHQRIRINMAEFRFGGLKRRDRRNCVNLVSGINRPQF